MNGEFYKMLVCMVLFAFLSAAVASIHPFGEPPSEMDDYFIRNGQRETGANNIVTSIVFDYRGLDTLGEASVLFTAVTGVFMLFAGRK
ncbi:MAG: hypothetical protein B6U72_01375 [Candidatus Altiarchaeales archaeon ex4484_2]|nr:MAG: hypothetical protein B6U72_01375 [Candidatus Altiarchaeales archaeon ex4484_2]